MNSFNPQETIENTISRLKDDIKSKTVLVAVSGGVDSATTAMMLIRGGVHTRCVFMDTGFMRTGESEEAVSLLKQNNIHADVLDVKDLFFKALSKITDTRQKRLVFRDVYFQVIEKYLRDNSISVVAQGSQSKSDLLKRNYHNVCDNEYINTNIMKVEPLLGLSKVEIRQMARALGLTRDLSERIPFPGPGLLIRFGGEYTPQKLAIIRAATDIVEKFKNEHPNEFAGCFQIFPYLCDGSSVTYINKTQTDYGSIILIRAVILENYIYKPFILAPEVFQKLTDELMKIPGVARVCLDMTPKNGTVDHAAFGATIEYQ